MNLIKACRMMPAAFLSVTVLSACSQGGGSARPVYEDMQEAFERSGLLSANIGIMTKTTDGDSVTYGECGSGVIIEKDGGTYYALTCAHVVSRENAEFLVFTVNNEMKSETVPGMDMVILDEEAYEAMYSAEVVYTAARDDAAVIRFETDEDLASVTLADSDPAKGDRILCVGNPQNDWFAESYGEVTSGIERFGEAQGFPSNVMKHSAWIHEGSSGGAAYNEKMQLAGTVPGGSFSLDGKDFRFGVLIPVSELKLCIEEWKAQGNS